MQLKLAEAAAKAIGATPADYAAINSAAKTWIASLGQPAQRTRAAYEELSAQGQWTFAKLMLVAAEFNALAAAVR